jgi:hypothetical protein
MLSKIAITGLVILLIKERLELIATKKGRLPKIPINVMDEVLAQSKTDLTTRINLKSCMYEMGLLADNEMTLEQAAIIKEKLRLQGHRGMTTMGWS